MTNEIIEIIVARALCSTLIPQVQCAPDCDCPASSNTARLFLAALSAAGYVIAPREPTEAMQEAGWGVHYRLDTSLGRKQAILCYANMLAAVEDQK